MNTYKVVYIGMPCPEEHGNPDKWSCIQTTDGYAFDLVFPEVATEEQIKKITKETAAAPDMLEALITVLPYIETAELDEAYKPGTVAKVTKQILAVIKKAQP